MSPITPSTVLLEKVGDIPHLAVEVAFSEPKSGARSILVAGGAGLSSHNVLMCNTMSMVFYNFTGETPLSVCHVDVTKQM